jgi:F420-dependent oxidoreductase-like protein
MRLGVLIDLRSSVAEICEQVRGLTERGFASAWASQIFGYDAIGLLSVVGAKVPDIELGTAVVPVYSRHPQVMAQQALTAQGASDGRFVLGVGLSHQVVVEGMWGLSFEHPARYLREYLSALVPMLHGEAVHVEGEHVTARSAGPLDVPRTTPAPQVVVAALGPTMLRIAGTVADGTVTWMTGTKTVAGHIVPAISAAARDAGRPAPRVVVSLPVTVTSDAEAARRRIDEALAIYPTLPSYRAMLDREGATAPSDVALVGDEHAVAAGVRRVEETGTTDFVVSVVGSTEERNRTVELLSSIASGTPER